jgi:hypothetical protein
LLFLLWAALIYYVSFLSPNQTPHWAICSNPARYNEPSEQKIPHLHTT